MRRNMTILFGNKLLNSIKFLESLSSNSFRIQVIKCSPCETSSPSFSTAQDNNTQRIYSQHRQQQRCQQLLSSPSHHHGLQPRSLTLTHTKPYSTLSPHRSLPVCAHPFHQHPRTVTLTPLRSHSPLALQDLKNPSLLDKIRAKLQLPLKTNIKKDVLRVSGKRLYLCCSELIDHDQFFEEFALEDTFASWFRIIELHIWMVFCRLMSEGYDGRFTRNVVNQALWDDVNVRAKKMGRSAYSVRIDQITDLYDQMRYALCSYDEGLLENDKVLAAALWSQFFNFECRDAEKLEKLVHYVHKQMRHLDLQETDRIMKDGLVTFLPLEGHVEDTQRSSRILKDIYNRIF